MVGTAIEKWRLRILSRRCPLRRLIGIAAVASSCVHPGSTTPGIETNSRKPVPLIPPNTFPKALFDSLGTVMTTIAGIKPGPYRRDIVVVEFKPDTPLPARQAAIDSISGEIVGGSLDVDGQDGAYYVRISGGTFDALVQAVTTLHRQPQVGLATWWELFTPDIQRNRRRSSSSLRPPSG